jgi:Flp pilus assembly protein TadG
MDIEPTGKRASNGKEGGFTLIATAVCLVALIGMLGLAVDVGRVYIIKNEAQAFADAGALAAARRLNGQDSGIRNARAALDASMSVNKWNMSSTPFVSSNTTLEFAQSKAGPWVQSPSPALGYAFARVTAKPILGLLFIHVVGGPTTQPISAQSVAGVVNATFPKGGYLPFTVFAHALSGADFGLNVGQEYTILWPGNVKPGNNSCKGDNAQVWIDNANAGKGSDRGYFELQSASTIRQAILGQRQLLPLAVGDILRLTNGQKQTEQDALTALAARDSDLYDYQPSPGTLPSYHGNGARLVILPINSGYAGYPSATPPIQPIQVLAFASFLIPMSFENGGNKAWCAIYMGGKAVGSDGVAPYIGAGAYVTKLVQ